MAAIFYKWLIGFAIIGFCSNHHPIFVSVTEIEHNTSDNTLEISCKIFTDDFESTLRKKYNTKVDLLNTDFKPSMNLLVNEYIQKHLAIFTNGKQVQLQFLGFEQEDEAIISYFEVKKIENIKKIEIINDILYEEKPQQMGIIHIMLNGERKSSRLNNPDSKASFFF